MKRIGVVILGLGLAGCVVDSEPTTNGPATRASTAVTTSTIPPVPSTEETLGRLGGIPCPDSDFTCVTLEMPVDHFDADNERTVEVTFAVLPANGESKGAFVTATGGPGSSGIAAADNYISRYDPSVTEQFDIVFFDQRGIGLSGGLTCPVAAVDYYRSPADVVSAAGLNRLIEAASGFSDRCIAEMGDPELLAHVGTDQAVEDLAAFQEIFDFDEFVLFGESYGTQFAQTYAMAYPERLDRMIIDGVVDLTLDGIAYHQQLAAASSRTLDLTLQACDEDELCSSDVATTAVEAYDRLHRQLLEGPLETEFPLPEGGMEIRSFNLADLEFVAAAHLYEEYDRMLLLRALAAHAGRGDLIPLLRLLYIDLGLDPQTQDALENLSWSDAMYYGVECLDYAYPGGTPEERVEAIVAGAPDSSGLRLASTYYGDLPCAFWPHQGSGERPPPLTAEGIPTLVLGSTVDPVTPYQQGVEVHSRLADGHIITKDGGPHVIFGWGEVCPDAEVTAFIVDGTPPVTETCQGEVVGVYQPLLTASPADEPELLLDAIEWEINYLPEYYYWDGGVESGAGCSRGGTVSFTATDARDEFAFDECG